jgi:hypothetical protein
VRDGAPSPAPPDFPIGADVDGSGDELPLALLRTAAQEAVSATVEQAARDAADVRAELDRLAEELQYLDRVERVIRTIDTHVPVGSPFILVDDLQLGLGPTVRGRRAIPFVERHGEYWGAPPDDEAAVKELDRQFDLGLRHIAIAWPSRWYLDAYPAWAARLSSACRTVVKGPDVCLFERV